MNRPKFTREQEDWLLQVIGDWYFEWKDKMTEDRSPHRLGYAKECLKDIIFAYEPDELAKKIIEAGLGLTEESK